MIRYRARQKSTSRNNRHDRNGSSKCRDVRSSKGKTALIARAAQRRKVSVALSVEGGYAAAQRHADEAVGGLQKPGLVKVGVRRVALRHGCDLVQKLRCRTAQPAVRLHAERDEAVAVRSGGGVLGALVLIAQRRSRPWSLFLGDTLVGALGVA